MRYILDHTKQCTAGGVQAALELFGEVRGEPITKEYLLEDLRARYHPPEDPEPNPEELNISDDD